MRRAFLRATRRRSDRYDGLMKKIQTRAAIVALIAILAALALGGWANLGEWAGHAKSIKPTQRIY